MTTQIYIEDIRELAEGMAAADGEPLDITEAEVADYLKRRLEGEDTPATLEEMYIKGALEFFMDQDHAKA